MAEIDVDEELVQGLAEFREAVRGFLARSEHLSRAAGVTTVQYQAMLAICAWKGPMAVGDLADKLILTHSAAVQMVQKLARAGLVQRTVAAEDRRIVRLELTPTGGRLLAELCQAHRDALLIDASKLEASVRRIRRIARGQGAERPGDGTS